MTGREATARRLTPGTRRYLVEFAAFMAFAVAVCAFVGGLVLWMVQR